MRKKITIDLKMVSGFGGLLFLIVALGLIGIFQIQNLNKMVADLAKSYMPMQNAVLEMKSINSKYAMGIRSYMFWRNAKYLEAASLVEKLNQVRLTSENFDKQLQLYSSLSKTQQQAQWVLSLRVSEARLRQIGDEIMRLIDRMNVAAAAEKKALEESINRQFMDFENNVFAIDAFLDDPVAKFNLLEIERKLISAEMGRRRSISFLVWSLILGVGVGLETAYLIYRRSKREMKQRESLCRTVIKVEEEERNNLSLQIHDQMGQDLSALKIFLGLIDRDIPAEIKEQKDRIEKTKKILDVLIEKSHNISELLRPPELDDLGLIESLAALLPHYKEMTGCHYNYLRPSGDIKLSPEYSLLIYRVVQESLTNIAKYSKAKNIEISLQKWEDAVYLTVSDDGIGFNLDEYLKRPLRRQEDKMKLGLQGLRERIELFGGTLTITSTPGQGTKLAVMLPA